MEDEPKKTPADHSFAYLQAESDRNRVAFLKNELALCFTFSAVAAWKYKNGNQESADISKAKAERAYETVVHVLSDPKHSKHLTKETVQECTEELERLRERLDGLKGPTPIPT